MFQFVLQVLHFAAYLGGVPQQPPLSRMEGRIQLNQNRSSIRKIELACLLHVEIHHYVGHGPHYASMAYHQ